jgi:hypothetical protein
VTAVTVTNSASNRAAVPYRSAPGAPRGPRSGRSAVRTLVRRGPVVRLYGRQHIDLQRVAGALCSR